MKNVLLKGTIFYACCFVTCCSVIANDAKQTPKQKKTIRVARIEKEENKLFYSKRNGKCAGYDVDIAATVGKALNANMVFKDVYKTYNDVADAVANGECDIAISRLSYTEKRRDKVYFSIPYAKVKKGLLLNSLFYGHVDKDKNIKDALNNKNTKIGAVKNSSHIDDCERIFPEAKIIAFDSWGKDVLPRVASGEIDVAVDDDTEIIGDIFKYRNLLIRTVPIIFSYTADDALSIAVNFKQKDLLDRINSTLSHTEILTTTNGIFNRYKDLVLER